MRWRWQRRGEEESLGRSCRFYVGKIKKKSNLTFARRYIIQCSRFSIAIPEGTAGAFISNAAVGILKQVPVEETNSQNRV